MARRRIFWHIGPDDAGTAWLGRALDAARNDLAAAGVLVPGTEEHRERVTAELRHSHHELGLARSEVEGSSAELVRELWKHRGTTLLSLPGLASATREQVALAMDGTRGAEHHVVLVERDLTSQLYAGARAALEAGSTTRPERFVERLLAAEPTDEAELPARAPHRSYWAGHDLPAILRRWTRIVLPENVHVVAESSPGLIWKRLVGVVGADVPLPAPHPPAVESDLGPSQLAVLRDVVIGLDDLLDARGRRTTLRDWLSRDLLARQPGGGLERLPAELEAGLRRTVEDWTDHLQRKGYAMHGTLSVERTGDEARSISPRESAAAALADALVEVDRLRAENADLTRRNAHLDKKRRKHKTRAKELAGRIGSA